MSIKKKIIREDSLTRGYQPKSPEPSPSKKGSQTTIRPENPKKESSPPKEE
jgi:hypothetical protein